MKKTLWASLVLVLISSMNGWATLSGDIEGLVKDPAGAVVSGAAVTIVSVATGLRRSVITDPLGHFVATLLPIGFYEVRAEFSGFAPTVQRVLVKSGERANLNIRLELGAISSAVRVSEAITEILTTTDAQLSMSIDEKRILELPLSYRDPLILATLSPGVIPVKAGNPFLSTGSFNANGGRGRANNITIDNTVATDVSVTGAAGFATVSVDAIQEFKLITNNFNAEFGRNASAQLQIITKRGTNEFHGTAYEFLRNSVFNSRDYFDTTGKANIQHWNQFGLTAGGPVVKGRLFYFGHYEGEQNRGLAGSRSAIVPTASQRGAVTDSTSRAILSDVNLPAAQFDDPTGAFGRVSQKAPDSVESNAFSGRMDYVSNSGRHLLTGRYAFQNRRGDSPGLTFFISNLSGFGASSKNKPQHTILGWTHLIGARFVNEARFSFGRNRPQFSPQYAKSTPLIIVNGFDLFGEADSFPQGRSQNTFQYSDTATSAFGRHTLKYGADLHRIQLNSVADSNVRGGMFFNSWDDFAAGRLGAYSQRFGSTVRGFRTTNVFAFAQDDYRIRPDLTINLGFRLEVAGGISEVNDILSNLDLNKPGPIGGAGPGTFGSFVIGDRVFHANYNPEPRVGFAWNPGRGNSVLRGGYGISHDFIFMNPITNIRFVPPFVNSVFSLGPFTGTDSYANLVAGTAAIQAQGRSVVGSFNSAQVNFGSFSAIDTQLNNPQTQQWNLTVEHALRTLALRVSYVGTMGRHLLRSRPINVIPPGSVRPASSTDDEIQRLAEFTAVAQRLFGAGNNRIDPRFDSLLLVESSSSSSYHALQAQATRSLSRGYQFQVSYTWSKSIDDVSDVLNVLANDSAAAQNPLNLRDNKGVSQFNIPHRLVVNHIWQLPVRESPSGVLGTLLHGWQFNGIFDIQSGFPTNIFSGTRFGIGDPALIGGGLVRPNLVGNLRQVKFAPFGSTESRSIPAPALRGVNTTAAQRNVNGVGFPLEQPLLGTFGNLGRNSIRLNRFANFDWVFLKNTKASERVTAQFRTEIYNVFNNTSFSGFVNNLASSAFGTYTATDSTARQFQFALRLLW